MEPVVTGRSEVSSADQQIARFLPPLSIMPDRSTINNGPLSAPAFTDYVLPNGEWIFSFVIGTSDVKRTWRGSDDPLVKALNDLEVHNTSYAFGVNAGRKYRSGFGFTTGLISERSEQQFSYTDRRTEVSQEVITWLVTLDSQVFVSDVDTVESVTTTEQRYNGFDRRSVLRIPLEGYFHRSAGRLHYGIRAGASIELTQVDQQHSLFFDRQEGRIEVTDLSGSELRARYPVMLSGAIGVDLGYSLAEHWSIEASPVLTSGIAPLTRTAEVWNSPSRFALQLRLNYHFTNRPRQ